MQPLPDGPKRQVSIGGGRMPVWNRNGSELFYAAPAGSLKSAVLHVVAGRLEIKEPQTLFPLQLGVSGESPFSHPSLRRVSRRPPVSRDPRHTRCRSRRCDRGHELDCGTDGWPIIRRPGPTSTRVTRSKACQSPASPSRRSVRRCATTCRSSSGASTPIPTPPTDSPTGCGRSCTGIRSPSR